MTKRPRRADSSSDAPREALRPKSSKLLHRDATSSSGSGDSGSDGCDDTSAAALVRSSERTEPPGILLASDITGNSTYKWQCQWQWRPSRDLAKTAAVQ